jgi:uncharacterized metal-binding protein YceD (DUF177 family)
MGKEKGRDSIQISVANIGRGLTLTLAGLDTAQIDLLKTARPNDKFQTLESIATPWTAPFLEETGIGTDANAVQGHIHLAQEGGVIRVQAALQFSPELECVRCLDSFRETLNPEAEAVFVDETRPSGQGSTHGRGRQRNIDEDELELQSSDLESYPFRGLKIQLDEFLLDTLQTALPDFPLCSEECRGLCSACGTNLNAENPPHICTSSKK